MVEKKYTVDLSEEERNQLKSFISSGIHSPRAVKRVRILLKADQGATDPEISDELNCSEMTAHRVRKRYAEGRLEAIHPIFSNL